jgi:hypothetical protein
MVLVVLAEEIGPEIIFAVAPDGMDVIGAVLDVVVLENEGGALNSISQPQVPWGLGVPKILR